MANGNFAGGNGTANNPYLIEDAHDLNSIRNNLKAYYKLINNIDLDVSPYNEGKGWIPVGLNFSGTLDGQGYKISNLFQNTRSEESGGLFKNLHGKITNILFQNVSIKSTSSSGVIAANASGATVENCGITSEYISPGNKDVGGFFNHARDATKIINSYSRCNVNGYRAGGFIGYAGNNEFHLINCYATGAIQGSVGAGGLIGDASSLQIFTNCFWDIDATGQSSGKGGGTGLSTQQMKTSSTYRDVGWDKEKLEDGTPIWILQEGEYPKLWFEKSVFFLIKSSNKIKKLSDTETWVDIELTEPLTKQDFKTHGITDLFAITKEQWDQLNDFEILTWTDNDKPEIETKSKNLELDNNYIGNGKLFRVELGDIVKVNSIGAR